MNRPPTDRPLMGEVRLRVPLPLVIPVVALAVIAGFTIGVSRVLLSLEPEAAVIVAIGTAANLLGACAFVALRPRIAGTSYLELLAIVVYPLLIGVVIASAGIGEEASAGHGNGGAPPPADGGGLTITAENIAFDKPELSFPAGEDGTLTFVNNDAGIDHNVAIYPNQESGAAHEDALFTGDIFGGVETRDYQVPAMDAGEYYFQCDVHPNMNGTARVE